MTLATAVFIGLPGWLWAQGEPKKDKESEEIIIRKKGDKDITVNVEIKGDEVLVNGKPLAEFKDDQITIKKRKMIIRDGDKSMAFDFGPGYKNFNFNKDNLPGWQDENETPKPFLGVTTEKVDNGTKITEVVKGSAAEKTGLKIGDIITKIGDDKIVDPESLFAIIASKKPGDEVKVYYQRNGKEHFSKAILGENKEKQDMAFAFSGPDGKVKTFKMPDMNMYNQNFPPEPGFEGNEDFDNNFEHHPKKLGLKIQDTEEGGNVKVIDVDEGSAAETAGLKKDDIITEIGGQKINNTDDAREQLRPEEGKNSYTIKAKRNGVEMNFEIKIPKKLKTANL